MVMQYFELFDIPVQLKVDTAKLTGRFFELSRKFHPDYFANADQSAQATALAQSALLNKAWKTFQNTEATIKYVLKEKGLLEEEEKYALPATFLMEMMELNEQLTETDASDTNNIQSTIFGLQNEIYAPVKKLVEDYQEGVTTEKELLQVKEYYYKKKYLDRIREQIATQ